MSDARLTFLLFLAGLLARMVAAQGAAIFGTDGGHYLLMADWMREGRFHDALLLTYHPLYPLLIGVVRGLPVSTEEAGKIVSVALGAGAVIPLFPMVRTVFGRPAAFVTGLLYAFSPFLIEVQSDVMTEGAYLFFFFSSMWLTWKVTEEPSLERAAILGAASAAAFLTRPEGLLAITLSIAWPAWGILRRRPPFGKRARALGAAALVCVLLLSPYLLWVKSQRGHWALSARGSAISGERAAGFGEPPSGEGTQGKYYVQYGKALFRLTGVLIPFYLLGLRPLRRLAPGPAAFYFSFPLGQMAGVLFALRTHNFMSDRYLMAAMALMSAVAALGLLEAWRWVSSRWPALVRQPAIGAAFLLVVAVLPGLRCLKLRRQECLSYPVAARWILSQPGPRPAGMTGPVEQVAYLCGSRSYYGPTESGEMLRLLDSLPIGYVVYSEKDVQNRADYIAMLRSCERLGAPVEIDGPPGTLKVFVQRVK